MVPAKASRSRASSPEPRRPRPHVSYSRDHDWLLGNGGRVEMTGRLDVPERCYSLMRGTPEEAFVAAVSSSQMFAFLALAAEHGATVTSYSDKPMGILMEDDEGLRVVEVVLNPSVTYSEVPATPAAEQHLHDRAKQRSILGNSITAKVSVYSAAEFAIAPR